VVEFSAVEVESGGVVTGIDEVPTDGSYNLVYSNGIFDAIKEIAVNSYPGMIFTT